MNYQNLKFAQVSILIAVSIYSSSILLLTVTTALALYNSDKYYITTILSSLCTLIPFFTQLLSFRPHYLLPFVCSLALSWAERKEMWKYELTQEKKMTIYLILLGLTTLNGKSLSSEIQLLFFFVILICKVMNFSKAVNLIVKILRIIVSVQSVLMGFITWDTVEWGHTQRINQNWWYIASFPLAVLYTSLLIDDCNEKGEESMITSEKSNDIELEDFSKKSQGQNENETSKKELIMQDQLSSSKISSKIQLSKEQQKENDYEQSQTLNLFLVIPFCLLKQGWIEILIYIYLFTLEWGYSRRWILALAMVSIGIISNNCSVDLNIGILLRVTAVLIVTKNLQGGYEIGEIIKTFWLRSSFALVLSVLFWYSLLTVNIFHLLFIAIILLFITKGSGESQMHSFRHRNWKYLLGLFNIFLTLRFFYALAVNSGWTINQSMINILQLSGISFKYVSSMGLFNEVPLFINAIIGLQFFTYNSKIYSKHTQSTLFLDYRDILLKVMDILTVIYYKLLPWVSYLAIISLLLFLEPSIFAFILLVWILTTLGTHILSRNEPTSYKRLFWFWLTYSRLTFMQIVLRYIFQFAKFDLLSFFKQNSIFQFLVQYEQLLGLAIRDQGTVYFKTVTKFQLMISLDLMSIFISFLVTEYYSLLLKYSKLPPHELWGPQQEKVDQIYRSYVDFKLTAWLQGKKMYKLINIFCKSFFQLCFPILGLFCCENISILTFIYLLFVLKYFLALNFQYYRTHIRSGYGMIVLNIVLNWNKRRMTVQTEQLNSQLRTVGRQMDRCKVAEHKRLRLFFVIVTIMAVLLTYISATLRNSQLVQLLDTETVLKLRWWLLVGGCNIQSGFIGHLSKMMLFLLVLQMKCSWFVNKFQITAKNYPPEQEEQAIIRDVLTAEEHLHEEDELALSEEMDGREIQSSILGQRLQEEREISEMRVSLLLGCLKLLERSFVMVLVFISIVLGSHPFGIVYLLCAILLNYLGSVSIKVLSRVLSILMVLQYFLVLSNYSNPRFYPQLTPIYGQFQQRTILNILLELPQDWQNYLTFGKTLIQSRMLTISWILLTCYQLYFVTLRKAWLNVLALFDVEIKLGVIGKKIFDHFRQVYEYGLTYSPLVIMLLCLFIYLLDYTTTNMFLTLLTICFIFVSFMVRDYRESRHFWRTYFVVLQLLIVCFMLIYSLLQLPMLSQFCNRLLCAPEQLHTQIYKALLLLILQIGLDLTSSYHFDRALRQFQHNKHRVDLQKLAIAYHHNDKKILQKFKQIRKQKQLLETVEHVKQFLKECKENLQLQFEGKGQNYETKQSWYNIIIQFLPSLIDEHLLLNEAKTKRIIQQENVCWMKLKELDIKNCQLINDHYMDDYGQLEGKALEDQLRNTLNIINAVSSSHNLLKVRSQKQERYQDEDEQEDFKSRKSFAGEGLPLESHEMVEDMRKTIKNEQEKQQLIYLLLVESVLSNWHYLTYFFLVLLHINNQGLLTLPIPAVVFCFGIVSSYQAGKQVWRCLLILVLVPLMFKFMINVQLLEPSDELIYLLIGDNKNSDLLEYICIIFIICQCVILKMIGHFDESTEEIQCMKIALVRNIINHNRPEEKEDLFKLMSQSNKIPLSYGDFLFGKAECKPGYDYSTLLTTLQLTVLIWIFLFYDKMAVRQQVTFYQMIEYNQFSSGMVALTLFQLLFLLTERFIAIVDLRSHSDRWQIGLLVKYILLICNFLLVQIVILVYFPLSSGQFQGNGYVTTLLVMNMLGLLVQSLQIKAGLDQSSRGFMDRYTWYNGFIYIGFRAIPFLFEFKAFSDWTFTRTALRIFDWIRLEEIFGRLYVAKCNALFLAGKQLGSKIEWWKKLLMGYPLLLSIILLLFGPLVLFSSLNPLASGNDVIAGYLQVILRINKTNEYPLYTNSHITDIHRFNASAAELQVLKLYDIDAETVQQLHLEEFSDQYWQISQGSYYKLLDQPEDSFYELMVRAKFDRNQTGISSLYVLSTYEIHKDRVPSFKQSLLGGPKFCAYKFLPTFLRLDNNNGLHQLGEDYQTACLKCTAGVRASKQYWVLQGGLRLRIASDKYTKAIFGYSVMSFYISIILVIANYFRFLFQGTVHTIITSDIPHPDPALALCNAIFKARRNNDLVTEEILFWSLIDLLRSPDTLKSLTGNYLQARLDTLKGTPSEQRKQD